MLKAMLIAATMLGAGAAYADEVVIHRDAPPPPPTTSTTTVEKHENVVGCDSKTVHKTDGEGDSKTVKSTNC